MKAIRTITTLAAALSLAATAFAGPSGKAPVPPPAQSPIKPIIGLDLDYASIYEFRGYDLGDNLLDAGLNLGLDFGNGLTIGVYTWYAALAEGDYQELDITPSIAYDFGPVTATVLYTRYQYLEGASENTNEVGLVLSTDPELLSGVSFSLANYYDFDIEGWYFQLGAGYSYALGDKVSLDFSTGISYVSDYLVTDQGFNHVYVGLAVPVKLTDKITLKPYVRGALPIDVLDDTGADDLFVAGATLSFAF